jgi:hypothetical protein
MRPGGEEERFRAIAMDRCPKFIRPVPSFPSPLTFHCDGIDRNGHGHGSFLEIGSPMSAPARKNPGVIVLAKRSTSVNPGWAEVPWSELRIQMQPSSAEMQRLTTTLKAR